MKYIKIILAIGAGIILSSFAQAQTLNWANLTKDDRHIINLNLGYDYAASFGAAYGYQLKAPVPIVLDAQFSMPAGENLFDDFKSKAGAQVRIFEWKSFCFSAEAQGIFRRYENPYARLLNFGSEFSGTIGYYRPSWFVAGQAGFDKAIVTHFKNSELYEDNYSGEQNGWYQPATGGNFFYGLQGGYSLRQISFYLKAGQVIEQDFKSSPMIPFYAQLGVNWKL